MASEVSGDVEHIVTHKFQTMWNISQDLKLSSGYL